MPDDSDPQTEYIIEFLSVGNSVKVTAIDPNTAQEVSIVGAPQISRDELSRLAIRKLKYVIDRNKSA